MGEANNYKLPAAGLRIGFEAVRQEADYSVIFVRVRAVILLDAILYAVADVAPMLSNHSFMITLSGIYQIGDLTGNDAGFARSGTGQDQ